MTGTGAENAPLTLDELRDTILDAALPHVPFDGWTMTALAAGARSRGLKSADVLRAFPTGPIDAIAYHSERADRRMVQALESQDLAPVKVRDRVALALRTRFEQNAADREAIRRALSVLSLPQNAPRSARLLYRTVDAVWYACGDTSTDFNFYTKRGLLAGVYSATLLYWLNDSSEGSADTWRFLDRRIGDVMRIPKMQARLGEALSRLPNPLAIRHPSEWLRQGLPRSMRTSYPDRWPPPPQRR